MSHDGLTVRLAFQESGSGPPLVVLHGLFGSGTNWRTAARRLATTHRVLLVDLRNHGASPHAVAMDYATLAGDLRALLDAEGLGTAALMGHSMGGKVAMRFALESPERVTALCVVDIAPARSDHDHGEVIAALRAVDLDGLTSRAQAGAQLAERIPEAGLRAFLLQNLRTAEDGRLAWRINLAAIEGAHDDLLDFPLTAGARYAGPCLFVRGGNSDYLLEQHEPAVAELFPRARIHTVPDAGHWLHAERPEPFLAAVLPFLSSLS